MRVVEQPKTITVELTEEEATILCALTGAVHSDFSSRPGVILQTLFNALSDNLPDREETFSDFFTVGGDGAIRVKR